MSAAELLKTLRQLDVRVWLQDDRVRLSAPAGRLTPELQKELSERKDELRRLLIGFQNTGSESRSDSSGPSPVQTAAPGQYCASFGQRRLWFLDQMKPGDIAYNIGASHFIATAVDAGAMEQSINDIVRRQGVLRTVFKEVGDDVVQVVLPFEPRSLQVIDLTVLPANQRAAELQRLKQEEAQRPFDLAKGPLFRAVLVKLDEDKHMLLFSMHHIICDGWSLGIFLQELATHYQSHSQHRESSIQPLTMQYGEYATRERQQLTDAALEQMLDYWRQRLKGAPPVLELPTDHPRPAIQTVNGSSVRFKLTHELSDRLRVMARQEQATLYMTLLGVFTTLMYRYSGQSDVVVGTPLANRDTPELEGLIGLFISTLAIRTQLDVDAGFRRLVAQIRENVLEGQANQDLPFEKLVEELRPERTLAWSPIFQVTFVLQNTPLASSFDVATAAAMYDLGLFCWDDAGGISGVFEFNTDLFDTATVERMGVHFVLLAEAMAADPEMPLSQLPMLAAVEREQLLTQWNATDTDYPRNASLVELFVQTAATHPDAIALETADESAELLPRTRYTYRELDQITDRFAGHLLARGVRPGAAVALCMDRSVAAIVSILSILKAGAAYVPLDAASPVARTTEILRDAEISLVVTQRSLVERLSAKGVTILVLEDEWQMIERASGKRVPAETSAEDLAYIMFTSGTTGKPKGVCVTHRGIVRLVRNTDYVQLQSSDVFMQFAPLAFDASTFEIWGALLNGARLVIYPQNVPAAADLAKALDTHDVTVLWLTAGFFHYMVENQPESIARVRQVLAGGDVLSVAHVQKILDTKSEGVVINGYGPTENTTFTCCNRMEAGAQLGSHVPIGRPIANTRVYILDAHGEPVPVGVAGELFTGGDGVAKGYMKDATLTAARFVLDPFAKQPGATMYRTGDLARWKKNGVIEFLGRRDRQVKVRGFRIELDEIEDALRKCARVHDAAVVVRRDASGSNALVGYLVPRPGTAIDQAEVRRDLAQRLPDYMMPAALVMLKALPLTANGKLDRTALPEPTLQASVAVIKPRTMIETQLLTIWERIFARTGFGVEDNFFDLGGHSLLAVRMFAQVERVFGKRIPVSALFQAPTIERLARHLENEGLSALWSSLVAIHPDGSRPPLFLVPGMGGNVLGYLDLSRLLGPDQPFYGLQARGLDGRDKPYERIEPMAEYYVSEIRKVQPQGPYYLGGACFGGVVAYEMAQQLRAAGEEVAFLMLLETWPPTRRAALVDLLLRQSQHLSFLVSAIRRNLTGLLRTSPKQFFKELSDRLGAIGEMVARRDIYRGDSATMYVDRVSTANLKAFSLYRPKSYDRSAFLVVASARRIRTSVDPRLSWAARVQGHSKVDIPALDSGLVLKSPHVEVLAAAMNQRLDEARREQRRDETAPVQPTQKIAASG